MKIICISDTHRKHHKIEMPEGDILIHAGDFTRYSKAFEIESFNEWLGELPFEEKICIAGNHEFLFDQDSRTATSMLTNATYLNDEAITVKGIKIWGSPITPYFYGLAFNRKRGEEINKHWELIPNDIDILVTHGPPFGILDQTKQGDQVGCEDLARKVHEIQPKLHIFGHVHEQYGLLKSNKTLFVNASLLDANFKVAHEPIVIDWE